MKDSLTGIEVLEIGVMTPGKFAGFLLTEWGARSIRVERPGTHSDTVTDEDLLLNRGKRSIILDLRAESSREIIYQLAARADIVLEGHRPGVAERLGINWDTLRKFNQKLIYCSISGFGQNGPDRLRPGFDLIFQAATGLLQATSSPGAALGPPTTFASDAATGLAAAFAVTAALRKAIVENKGTYIDLAMQDVAFSMLAVSHGTLSEKSKQTEPAPSAAYNIYRTSEGRHVAIGAARPASCLALFEHLGRADLAERGLEPGDKEATNFLREIFSTKTSDEWVAEISALDVEISKIRSPAEAFDDPQLLARNMVSLSEHPLAGSLRQIGAFTGTKSPRLNSAPEIGRDTNGVLTELGYDMKTISDLRHQGII